MIVHTNLVFNSSCKIGTFQECSNGISIYFNCFTINVLLWLDICNKFNALYTLSCKSWGEGNTDWD